MTAVMNTVSVRGDALADLKQRWQGLNKSERGVGLKNLVGLGFSMRELAGVFCCSESLVRQLVKLAELPATVLEEYEAGEIGRKRALALGKKLRQVKPPRVKRQTRIKRGARHLEAWVRSEMPLHAWEVFFGEVRYETEGPQGAVFKCAACPAAFEDEYADPADVIADYKPLGPPSDSSFEETNRLVEWYARWFQRVLPDRADREEALRIVMATLVPHM